MKELCSFLNIWKNKYPQQINQNRLVYRFDRFVCIFLLKWVFLGIWSMINIYTFCLSIKHSFFDGTTACFFGGGLGRDQKVFVQFVVLLGRHMYRVLIEWMEVGISSKQQGCISNGNLFYNL